MAASLPARQLRRIGLTLLVVALAAGFNVVLSGGAGAQDVDQLNTEGLDPALVAQGQELFGQHCIMCHGSQGQGNVADADNRAEGTFGPSLQGVGAAAVDFMVRTGRMPMTDANNPLERQQPQFDDTERAALVAYVNSLVPPEERGPDIPDVSGWQDADLGRGLELFTTNCAACHGPTAAGIAVGQKDISSNLKVSQPIDIGEAVRIGPGVMPVFGPEVITDEDLDAIVAWVRHVTHRESEAGVVVGRGGPVSEGMIAWIVGLAVLGIVIYLLGERHGTEDVSETDEDGPAPATGAEHG